MEVVLVEPARMPRGTDSPGELTVDLERVALDDFGGVLASVVEALIGAGMDKAVAWGGTRRVVELSLGSSSRRPTRAGDDPRLAGLGADAVCARAWMTLVVGSWRAALGLAADELASGPVGRGRLRPSRIRVMMVMFWGWVALCDPDLRDLADALSCRVLAGGGRERVGAGQGWSRSTGTPDSAALVTC